MQLIYFYGSYSLLDLSQLEIHTFQILHLVHLQFSAMLPFFFLLFFTLAIVLYGNIDWKSLPTQWFELWDWPVVRECNKNLISALVVNDFWTVSSRDCWVNELDGLSVVFFSDLSFVLVGLKKQCTCLTNFVCPLPLAWLITAPTPIFDNKKVCLHFVHRACVLSFFTGAIQSLHNSESSHFSWKYVWSLLMPALSFNSIAKKSKEICH